MILEHLDEALILLRENHSMLKEILELLRKTQDPDYKAEENVTDFIMNIVVNLVASDIEKRNGRTQAH